MTDELTDEPPIEDSDEDMPTDLPNAEVAMDDAGHAEPEPAVAEADEPEEDGSEAAEVDHVEVAEPAEAADAVLPPPLPVDGVRGPDAPAAPVMDDAHDVPDVARGPRLVRAMLLLVGVLSLVAAAGVVAARLGVIGATPTATPTDSSTVDAADSDAAPEFIAGMFVGQQIEAAAGPIPVWDTPQDPDLAVTHTAEVTRDGLAGGAHVAGRDMTISIAAAPADTAAAIDALRDTSNVVVHRFDIDASGAGIAEITQWWVVPTPDTA